MSAVDAFAKFGGGVKNLAIGVGILAAGAGAVYVAAWLSRNREKFNPTSDQNLAYQGVNSVVQAATGDGNATLGSWLYDLVNGSDTGPCNKGMRDAAAARGFRCEVAADGRSERLVRIDPEPAPESDQLSWY